LWCQAHHGRVVAELTAEIDGRPAVGLDTAAVSALQYTDPVRTVLSNSEGSIWITLNLQGELRRGTAEVVAVLQERFLRRRSACQRLVFWADIWRVRLWSVAWIVDWINCES
jgi:hypothetical protein